MRKSNVLFIPVDDLRPQLGCYGRPHMRTPHLDELAAEGTLFRRAYCQVPVCGATRASLLTGRRPARNRFVDFATWADKDLPGARTLPEHFRQNGYTTVSVGKVFHHPSDTAERSWSNSPWRPEGGWRNYLLPENVARNAFDGRRGPPFECADAPDNAYSDGQIADRAIAELQTLAADQRPFFLAAGFLKPHLPFNAPRRYWDLYRREDVALADNPFRPRGAPDQAMHEWGELRNYFDVPQTGPLSEELARTLVHGYYAATSYVDAQIGRVLRELDRLGLRESTTVVVWGDHGWQLGEHSLWCKHCNFNTSLQAPLILRAPGLANGRATDRLAAFLDVYPTLCELAELPVPEELDGRSLVPLLHHPADPWTEAVFGRFHAGDSIRTERHLYTEWTDNAGRVVARMLYDHDADPDENVNVAEDPANTETVAALNRHLEQERRRAISGQNV